MKRSSGDGVKPGQIARRHERRRFGGGNARGQEHHGNNAQPTSLITDDGHSAGKFARGEAVNRQRAMTSTSRSTPLTTRNSLS
jgi:hypothetical protein